MNCDAEYLLKEKTKSEDIKELLEVMKKVSEQLEYIIEILE